ncbi:MAG: hypothetical protein ACTH1Z_04310 [Ancrocorticia sp.]|uniref:hypothetical protein n=1 Tax=Ancrocorticia sp. TaxID=2593684 RepID=UPI003F9354BF
MMRRIASTALATLGIIAMIIGIGFMTFWAPDGNVRATAAAPDSAFIKTEPGVIDLVGEDVSISLEAPDDSDVIVAFGVSDDIDAWAEGIDVASVSGLSDWDTLKVTEAGDGTPAPVASETPTPAPTDDESEEGSEFEEVDPELLAGSDMWIQVEQEANKVDVSYKVADSGAISLLATTTSGQAPSLTLSWDRDASNSFAMPLLVIGALVALIGILLFILDIQEGRRRAARRAAREDKLARRAARSSAATSVISAVDVDELLKSNDSIAEEARDVQDERTAHEFGAGIVPASSRAEDFRSRELADEDRLIIDLPAEEESLEEEASEGEAPEEETLEGEPSADESAEDGPSDEATSADEAPAEESAENSANDTAEEPTGEQAEEPDSSDQGDSHIWSLGTLQEQGEERPETDATDPQAGDDSSNGSATDAQEDPNA